jgi:hypothetical protein
MIAVAVSAVLAWLSFDLRMEPVLSARNTPSRLLMPKRVQVNTLNHAEVIISLEGELRAW